MKFSEEFKYIMDLLNKTRMALYNAHRKQNVGKDELENLEKKEKLLVNICRIIDAYDRSHGLIESDFE